MMAHGCARSGDLGQKCAGLSKIELPTTSVPDSGCLRCPSKAFRQCGKPKHRCAGDPKPAARNCVPCGKPRRASPHRCPETFIPGPPFFRPEIFQLPPIPDEDCIDSHTRFSETTLGYLSHHSYGMNKYYRNFQGRDDYDIIRHYLCLNLCSGYPDVTYRYFAMNWPEYCIFAFTDTHIPIGVIMAHQVEPRVARITMFAVEHRVDHKAVAKRLLKLELEAMTKNDIHRVLVLPETEKQRIRMLRQIGDAGPLRFINKHGDFEFSI